MLPKGIVGSGNRILRMPPATAWKQLKHLTDKQPITAESYTTVQKIIDDNLERFDGDGKVRIRGKIGENDALLIIKPWNESTGRWFLQSLYIPNSKRYFDFLRLRHKKSR